MARSFANPMGVPGAGFSFARNSERGEMPEQENQTAPTTAPSPESPPAGDQGGVVSPDQWFQSLDQQGQAHARAIAEAFHATQAKSLETELHGLRSEKGRLSKAADPVIAARLGQEERIVELLRGSAITLYGQEVEEDLKDIDNLDGLATALKFLSKGSRKAAPADPSSSADPATQDAWKAFQASRNGNANAANGAQRTEEFASGRAAGVATTSDKDFIRAYADGEVDDPKRAFEIAKRMGVRF